MASVKPAVALIMTNSLDGHRGPSLPHCTKKQHDDAAFTSGICINSATALPTPPTPPPARGRSPPETARLHPPTGPPPPEGARGCPRGPGGEDGMGMDGGVWGGGGNHA